MQECRQWYLRPYCINPKRAGLFWPISQPEGADSSPHKISETDRWNIKCVVLVNSYDPPESIGTKKNSKHTLYDVTVTSCQKHENHQKSPKFMVFRYFFQAKVAFFSNDVCQSMLTHVLTPNKPNK